MNAGAPKSADLIIKGGCCVTSDPDQPVLASGSIAIKGGVIAAIDSDDVVAGEYIARDIVDARGAIVHAGFIEPHVHLTSAGFHGLSLDALAQSGPTYSDLKSATDDEVTAALAAAFSVAMLRKGFTCFAEAGTVFETDAMAEAVTECGVRALVAAPYAWDELSVMRASAPGLLGGGILDRAPASFERSIDACAKELKRNANPKALVRGFVCIYGEGSASDELTSAAKKLAREHRVIFNEHLGYLSASYIAEQEKFGMSGVRRLQRLDVLDNLTTLTHLNAISAADADILVTEGVNAIWCPLNVLQRALFLNNESQHIGLLRRGVPVGLAVDTFLSFPPGAQAIAASLLSGTLRQPLSGADILSMQTLDAARCLGLDEEVGSLVVGKRADIVIRAPGDITQTPVGPADNLMGMSGGSIPVDTVVIDGRIVMRDGQTTLVDERATLDQAIAQRTRLLQRAGF
ncbi:amidohydrolase family protein [Microvirga sp. VF16]|uniref:amidohydrolase family protein n=1 Tax=Microvirga sp. VF16 TaxID=2807101 RepID=UPI00193D6F1F|nr:amidohydrolase family protein [Microvirga sp. VF16]QRM32215.1 amidohydrolase family protein [Microvirga sp. VF16]